MRIVGKTRRSRERNENVKQSTGDWANRTRAECNSRIDRMNTDRGKVSKSFYTWKIGQSVSVYIKKKSKTRN